LYSAILSFVEEVWELVEAIRQYKRLSFNKKKVEEATLENIWLEAVDVLITLFLILKRLWINNLEDFLEKKIKLNKDRGY
jgi:NTP pyrophosphatase (non-canonical NTP hydrolase)